VSRVLIVGMGVPGFVHARRHAGPGLRAAHFAAALAGEGHEVLLLAVLEQHQEVPTDARPVVAAAPDGSVAVRNPAAGVAVEYTTEKDLLTLPMRRRLEAFAPDAVVGVTVYAAALAARLHLVVPLWADVFGDIMAEAQAKAARSASDWSIVHFWTLLRGVLEAADRFSAVSVAQAHALVGQLGLAGRLSMRTAGEELVATIPCAVEAPRGAADRDAARGELGFDGDEFVLLVSGGVNTWCDVETLAAGVAAAMRSEPRLRVVLTGGPIPGHDEASYAALLAALQDLDTSGESNAAIESATLPESARVPGTTPSRVPGTTHLRVPGTTRMRVLGWIESSRLPAVYAAADLALHIERPLYERRLGAENRVVEWLAHGLPFVTTAGSETGRELVEAGIALACRSGDAADLARVITRAMQQPEALAEAAARGRQWVADERGYPRTAEPLLRWCAAPVVARDRDGARLVRLGLLSHPETSVEMLEAYVAALPLREIVRRGLRWIVRRAWTAASRPFASARRPQTGPGEPAQPAPATDSRFRAQGRRW